MKEKEEKKEILYIFDGLGEAFEKEYEVNKPHWWKDKDTHWKYLMGFCTKYTELDDAVIPAHQTKCLVETKQNYGDFSREDILHVIKYIGQLANLVYGTDRDLFLCMGPLSEAEDRKYKPLQKYYQRAIQRVMWRVATFTQDEISSFTDFETKLREMIEVRRVSERRIDDKQ